MLAQILTQITSIVGGGINSALGLLVSTIQKGFQSAIQFHKEGIAFARDVGLSAKQAQAYTDVLIKRTEVLANKYGVSAKAILDVQRNLSEATGKQLMLNDAQAESFVQIDKMMGAQARSKFTEEIMNGMGGQVDTVSNAMAKVYATAAKQGLNAKKLTDKVAQNLSMANRLSFKNGIDGITRMAALSEKLGINMQSVESAAGQFMELDKAIENAAQMQMLGGSAVVNFGNPLTAAYEANYDPEAFAQRMSDSLASYATFDASKGVASINGMNMDFVRNIAKTMGISVDDAAKMAKKQAEVKYKENTFGSTLDNIAGGDEAKRNYILNNSQLNTQTGRLEVQGKDINSITPDEWEKMMHFDQLSDKEILAEQAQTLTSIDEHIEGAKTKVAASFAEGVDKYLLDIGKQIQGIGDYLAGFAKQWGNDTGQVVGKAMAWINQNGDTIKTIADGVLGGITKVYHFFAEHWKGLIAAILGWKLLKGLFASSGGGGLIGNAAKGIGGGLKSVGKSLWGGTKGMFSGGRWSYQYGRANGEGRLLSSLKAPGRAFSMLSKGAKVATVGGAALGIGIGAYKAFTADNNAERGEGIGTIAGTAIGTAIAGPLGAAVGGWLGGVGGKLIGEHWEDIKNFAKGAWESTKNLAASTWDGIKSLAKGAWDLIPEDARNAITSSMKAIAPIAETVWNGIKVIANGYWTAVKGMATGTWTIIKGTALGTWNVIKGVGLGAWSVIKGVGLGVWQVLKGSLLGVWEIIKGAWNGLWDLISAPFKAVADVVNGIKEGFAQITSGNIIDGIMTMLGGVGKGLFDLISAPFKAITDVGIGMWNGIGEFAKGIWNGLGEVVKGIWNGLGEVVKGIWNGIGEFVKGIWTGVGEFVKGIWEGAKGVYQKGKNWVKEQWNKFTGDEHAEGGFINTGAVGVESPVLAQKGEVILNPTQQRNFMALANDTTSVKAKEYGAEREYIYKPNGSETSNVNGNTITVKDFNINLSGTLKLDGGNSSRNIDMNALLNDYQFMNALKEMIKTSINNDMNGGRFMNDIATMRGQISSTSIIGR